MIRKQQEISREGEGAPQREIEAEKLPVCLLLLIFSYSYLFQQQESARGRNEGGIGVHLPVGEPAPERWEARRSDSTSRPGVSYIMGSDLLFCTEIQTAEIKTVCVFCT